MNIKNVCENIDEISNQDEVTRPHPQVGQVGKVVHIDIIQEVSHYATHAQLDRPAEMFLFKRR